MAKKITAKMIAKFEKAIKAWKDDIKHAKDVISRLDTIVRDQVPTDLYDTLFDAYDK